jgi:hypothetical protein
VKTNLSGARTTLYMNTENDKARCSYRSESCAEKYIWYAYLFTEFVLNGTAVSAELLDHTWMAPGSNLSPKIGY